MADSRGRSFDDADAAGAEADDSSAFASSTGGDGDEERSLSLESMTNVRLRRRPQRIPSSVEVEGDGDLGELSAVTLNISQPYFVPLSERDIREGAGEGGPPAPLVASPSHDDRKSDHKNSNELRQSKESYDIDSLIDDASAHGNGNGNSEWAKMTLLKQVLCEDMSDSITEDIDIRRSLTEESLLGDHSNKRQSSLFDADGGSYILSERASSFDANRTGLCLNLDSEDKDLGIEGSSCEGVRSRYAATSKKRVSEEGGECPKGGDELPSSLPVGKLATAQSYISEEEKEKEGIPKLMQGDSKSGGVLLARGDGIDSSLVTAVAARGREEPNDRRSSTTTLKWKNTGKLEEQEGNVQC